MKLKDLKISGKVRDRWYSEYTGTVTKSIRNRLYIEFPGNDFITGWWDREHAEMFLQPAKETI